MDKHINTIHKTTDKMTEDVVKVLKKQFEEMGKKILQEIASIHAKYEKGGKLTYEEMSKYNRLNTLISKINGYIDDLIKGEYKYIAEGIKDCYKLSYEYMGYAFEKETLAYLDYGEIKGNQLQAIVDNPVGGLTLNDTLQKNRSQVIYDVKRTVTQAIYNGYSYGTTAKLLKDVFQGDYVKAVRVARTEMARAVEVGKYESAMKAKEQGVIETKTWKTSRDSRVRDAHNKLYNVTIPIDEMFDLGDGYKGIGPKQTGYAWHDINCRCRLHYKVVDVKKPKHDNLAEMEFEEWRKKRLK